MQHEKFIEKCVELVLERENRGRNPEEYTMTKKEDVFVVWSCKALQNSKAILSTKLKGALMYEITLNGDKKEIYVDAYSKKLNECIKV
ncbi:DUF6275 family protein [Enterococcus sp. SMC-9]|uniref:DUF6275 family protein n=1 Tax=Enterococcus sp. SMC-9 TaxID=2862343 RepID=UPI001E64DBF9|nr:DUF6275 family protein [Enterococcus sp. SMC-9]MCD1025716.1 DUF6275 family protein [Enterococcus sp. SMC-9]